MTRTKQKWLALRGYVCSRGLQGCKIFLHELPDQSRPEDKVIDYQSQKHELDEYHLETTIRDTTSLPQ